MAEEAKMKKCSKCGKEFPATTENFHKCKQTKDGLHQQCKPCKNASDRIRTHNNYPIVKRKRQENKAFIKQLILDIGPQKCMSYIDGHIIFNKIEGFNYVTSSYISYFGYAIHRIYSTEIQEHLLVWCYFHNKWSAEIDHINGDKADNRIENLRECNPRENNLNRDIHRDGHLAGASWSPTYKAYMAKLRIGEPRKTHIICIYETEREASLAYCKYCLENGLARREFMPAEFTDEELGIIK